MTEQRITSRKNPLLQQVKKLFSSRRERESAGLFAALRELLDVLREQGTLDETSRVYATHINHWTSNHEQLAAYFAGQDLFCPFTVAWDGMQIPQDGPDR